ncbi:MAG: hypothetical protein ABIQ73_29255 [Acidimicrobiales bacterium]
MRNRNHRRGGRTTPKGTRPADAHRQRGSLSPVREALPPVVADANASVRECSPLALLMLASGLVEMATPRPLDSWSGRGADRPDGPSVFESFAASGWPSMAALAVAVATLHSDELLSVRLRIAAEPNLGSGPTWFSTMDRIEIIDTVVHSDPLDDGENAMLSWRWPDGTAATLVLYVDHNMGTIVKDAFALPEGASAVAALFDKLGDRHIARNAIDASDARARIADAIKNTDRMIPPLETETWPTSRPLVEWLLRHLPEGGTGYVRPDWSSSSRDQLIDEFVGSSFGDIEGVTRAQVRELVDPLVWFACDFGPGDPLRWSPVSVEIVLTDWYPRKVFNAPLAELRLLPRVLAGFVRFSHARRDIPAELTDDTLTAIEHWTDEFVRAISHPGRSPFDNAARLARMAAGFDSGAFLDEFDGDEFDGDEFDGDEDPDDTFIRGAVDELEARVIEFLGGRAAYDALDDVPLGDVAFDWSQIPPGLADAVGETLSLLDRWAIDLFDVEVRTIARSVLAGVIAADPSVFKRSPRADALAAAILGFLLMRLTGRLSAKDRRQFPWKVFTQRDLATAVGVSASTVGSRSKTVSNVVARADIVWPSILHSTQRRDALRTKQLVMDWRSAQKGNE